jgi:hypothetical protein
LIRLVQVVDHKDIQVVLQIYKYQEIESEEQMEKNTALAIKGLQSDRRIVDESNSGIGGRNQYFGKEQQYHKGQT